MMKDVPRGCPLRSTFAGIADGLPPRVLFSARRCTMTGGTGPRRKKKAAKKAKKKAKKKKA
jgi:hypothetical protein